MENESSGEIILQDQYHIIEYTTTQPTTHYSKRRRLREAPASRGPGLRGRQRAADHDDGVDGDRHRCRIRSFFSLDVSSRSEADQFRRRQGPPKNRRRRTDYEEPHYKWYVGRGAAGRTGQEER